MLDLFLAYSLLKAVRLDAQVLLVGDTDQLPQSDQVRCRPDQLRTGAGDADSGVPTSRHKLSVMLTGLTAASFLNLHAFLNTTV